MRLKTGSAVAVVALLAMTAAVGVGYAVWNGALVASQSVSVGYTNADFVAAETDDPPGTIDPGYDKDVGCCTATVVSEDEVAVVLDNAYPSYTCTFTTTIQNNGTLPERRELLEFTVPSVLRLAERSDLSGLILDPGESDVEEFSVHVEQQAAQSSTYVFTIRKPFSLFVTGTPGFWKNWDSHNTFTQAQIEGWLAEIDAASAWLGPTTTDEMEAYFVAYIHQPRWWAVQGRFLAHYLATRLDERSGILDPTAVHDVTGPDPGNYLGLANPGAATLAEIISAIESKYGMWPSIDEFEKMKDVCDALNNLDI